MNLNFLSGLKNFGQMVGGGIKKGVGKLGEMQGGGGEASAPMLKLPRTGGAYACWYADDSWHAATGWPDDLAWWFEIPLIGLPANYSEE